MKSGMSRTAIGRVYAVIYADIFGLRRGSDAAVDGRGEEESWMESGHSSQTVARKRVTAVLLRRRPANG